MKKRELFRLLIIGFLLVLVSFGVVFAAGRGKAYGRLTSIEDNGTVVIKNGRGQPQSYLLSPSVIAQNSNGEGISLQSIILPCYIYVEFEYTKKGSVISLMKMQKNIPR